MNDDYNECAVLSSQYEAAMPMWPWKSSKVKGHGTKWKGVYDFLQVTISIKVSIVHSYNVVSQIAEQAKFAKIPDGH